MYIGTGICVIARAVVRDRPFLDRLVAVMVTSENQQGNGLTLYLLTWRIW